MASKSDLRALEENQRASLPPARSLPPNADPVYIKVPTKSIVEAYILCFPLGFLGLHHFYLRRLDWCFFYLCTFGVLGFGWLIDLLRLPCLVSDVNKKLKDQAMGHPSPPKKRVDDAYILVVPLGFLGLHHFYLYRPCWGVLYLCTFGLLGVGWLVDMIRMPCLVNSVNEKLMRESLQLYAPTEAAGMTSQTGQSVTVHIYDGSAPPVNPTAQPAPYQSVPPAAGYPQAPHYSTGAPPPYDGKSGQYGATSFSQVPVPPPQSVYTNPTFSTATETRAPRDEKRGVP